MGEWVVVYWDPDSRQTDPHGGWDGQTWTDNLKHLHLMTRADAEEKAAQANEDDAGGWINKAMPWAEVVVLYG